jgi:hypothetical protein
MFICLDEVDTVWLFVELWLREQDSVRNLELQLKRNSDSTQLLKRNSVVA